MENHLDNIKELEICFFDEYSFHVNLLRQYPNIKIKSKKTIMTKFVDLRQGRGKIFAFLREEWGSKHPYDLMVKTWVYGTMYKLLVTEEDLFKISSEYPFHKLANIEVHEFSCRGVRAFWKDDYIIKKNFYKTKCFGVRKDCLKRVYQGDNNSMHMVSFSRNFLMNLVKI